MEDSVVVILDCGAVVVTPAVVVDDSVIAVVAVKGTAVVAVVEDSVVVTLDCGAVVVTPAVVVDDSVTVVVVC